MVLPPGQPRIQVGAPPLRLPPPPPPPLLLLLRMKCAFKWGAQLLQLPPPPLLLPLLLLRMKCAFKWVHNCCGCPAMLQVSAVADASFAAASCSCCCSDSRCMHRRASLRGLERMQCWLVASCTQAPCLD